MSNTQRCGVGDEGAFLGSGPGLGLGALQNRSAIGRRLLMAGCVLLLGAALAFGLLREYALHTEAMGSAQQPRELALTARTAIVRASPSIISVRLPAITQAFAQANNLSPGERIYLPA